MGLIPQLTSAGKAMMVKAMTGQALNFTRVKLGDADAPSSLSSGDYWYDTENEILYQYMDTWVTSETAITITTEAPEDAEEGDLYYNPSTGILYKCADGWVAQNGTTIACTTTAPSSPSSGDYWYDTANNIFYVYGSSWGELSGHTMTCSETEPENPAEGDYWYDTEKAALLVCTATWNQKENVNITVGDTEPESPADGDYWYDTVSEALKVCRITEETTETEEGAGNEETGEEATDGEETGEATETTYTITWEESEQAITVAEAAPESGAWGDWWYNSSTDTLYEYGYAWDDNTTHTFSYGTTAPENPAEGDWWYDTALHVYRDTWIPVTSREFTYGSVAPTSATRGDWWYNSSDASLYVYGATWAVDSVDTFSYTAAEPTIGLDGDYWYDTENAILKEYASGWFRQTGMTFTYSSLSPANPSAGDWWYNSGTSILYEYSGAQWVTSYAAITCSISQPNTAEALTDLINPIMVASIAEILKGSNYVSLTTTLSNAELSTGFQWSETGIFAQIDGGEEELYAYCNAGDLYDYIPSNASGRTIEETFTLLVMVGDAEEVTATIGDAAQYATKEALEEHLRDSNNPHKVTAEDVGLGNVENVAPGDMTVEYTTATELTEPVSGEKLSVLFGKIKKAISTLITHLKADNPHSITAAKIGAAASDHTHFVTGTFTGDGANKRLISLDFTPSAVILTDCRGRMYDDAGGTCGGMAVGSYGVRSGTCTLASHESTWSTGHTALLITTNGFYVSYYSNYAIATNTSDTTYRYIAFK